ncbi:MAG TPA: homoserine dehydrogenase, partial [Anaerolineaceae bacterium]
MSHYRLCLIGFGNVGQAFVRLLMRKQGWLERECGMTVAVTGIRTGRHGAAIDPQGLNLEKALQLMSGGRSLDELSAQPAPTDGLAFIRACPADVLFENSPVNHETGQPAIDNLCTALEEGM